MEHALILLAVLDFSYLVFANQGEPGSFSWHTGLHSAAAPTSNKIVNPVGSTEMKLHVLPTLSGTANLLHMALSLKSEPVRTSDRNDNSVKSTEMMMTAAVLDFSGTTASESPTSSLKLEAVTTSFAPGAVKESLTTDHEGGSLTAIQTPKLSDLQASTIDLVRGSILVSRGISSHSVMQSANVMQSQIGPASLTHLDTPTQVEQPSIISTSQSIVSQVMPSAQVSQFTSTVKIKSSSLYLSASQSLEAVDMTTKTPLSSSTHATALLSTGSIAALSTPPSVNSSGLASYGSSLLMSSSVSVPEFNTSRSQEGIHPTTTYLPTMQSSLLLSSSAFMPPTTAPPPGNPAPPVILDATALSATSILLQWNASNAQFIANFSVDFSTDSISWNHASCQQSLVQGACTVNQTEARVTLLKPYTNYTFRVAAQGAFGKTNYSIESTWILTSEAVPSQPDAVKAIAVNSTAIFVNWTEPAEVNGVIIKYEVRYAMINSSQSADAVIRSVQDTMNVVLSSLNPFTFYEISVSAFTSKGKGNRTTVQEQTDEGQPSAPQNISTQSLNSTAILVSWEKPADPNGRIKYRLSLRKESNPVATFAVAYDGGSTQYLVSNLKPFTQYSFKVNAYNVKYNLLSSSLVVRETTAEAAPSGPPQNLHAITNSSSSIILYWMPPKAAEQNGQITNYNIHINSALEQARRINTSATTFAVIGLQAYTNYSFMVQAVTVGGTGPYSGVVANITFEAEPSAPRNVTAKSANSTAIKVTWVEALHPNGVILYKLYMRSSQDDESTNQLPVYEGLGTTYVATGLQEYVMYTFTVVSFNVKYNWTSQQIVAKETTHPAEPAGPPQNVAVVPLSSSSIEVTWRPPLLSEQNGVIIHYTVKYSSKSGQSGSVNTSDNSTTTVIKDLSYFTSYSFTVKAWNVVGSGPDSEPVNITTLEDRPSPPTNVGAQTMNATAIRVTWQEPLHPNGEIAYRLFFWQTSEGFETGKLAYDGLLLESTVAGLHEYVTYTFMVLAYNVEHSWSSEAVNVSETTHPAAPAGSPQDVMALTQSSTSILIKWRPPLELDRNGIITRYIVKYNVSSGKEANNSTSDNTTRILVTNLKKYSSYYFTVQAENNIGVGPPSEVVVNTTFEDVPGAPVIEGVNNTKPDSLEVMWKPPAETNGVIKAYRLCWSLANLQNRTCVKLNGARRSHEIPKLKPYTEYRISLNASTSVGVGPAATYVSRTAEGMPSKPRDIRAWNTSEYSIFVTWKTPLNVNGVLKGYKLLFKMASSPAPPPVVVLDNKTTLRGLKPYTSYIITVQAFTSAGDGATDSVEVMTDETAPSSVGRVNIDKKTSDSIELSWPAPARTNGKIGYNLSYTTTSAVPPVGGSFVLAGNVNSKVVSNLKPYTEYQFAVVAYNLRRNLSAAATYAHATTFPAKPKDPPRNIVINGTTSVSITLSWVPPPEPNGIIEGYDVMYYDRDQPNKKNINENVKGRVHTILDLEPFRHYRIRVACQSSGGLGPYSEWVEQRTDPGAPPPLGTLPPPKSIQSSSFSVVLTEASNEKGIVSFYQVIVIELATDNNNEPVPAQKPDSYKPEDLYTYDQARKRKPQLVPYIAAQFSASEFDRYKDFVVGDGRRTSSDATGVASRRRRRETNSGTGFVNGRLEENTYYAVFQRAYVNKDVYRSSSWIKPVATAAAAVTPTKPASSTHIGLIVGLILVIVVIAVLILVGFFVIRRKRTNFDRVLDDREDFTNGQPVRMKKLSRKRRSLQKRLMGSTESLTGLDDLAARRERRQPVPIDDFERHVDRMHMDGDHGFSEEYTLVQPGEEFSFQQFLNPANKYKNRYANIVAYDHTRVLLNPIEGVAGSDYINANFVDGYNRQRAYIAAQGPLMETFDDFWRMMWEQMSSIIVMLTKLEERGRRKCDQYWPERGTKSYGPIQVTLKETLNMSHYTVRKFIVTHKKYPDDDRVIRQFHFTAWPDHGVPSHPTHLLSLVRHTSSANRESVGPMVVHCSAGVGRTGTFITLDVMLHRISQEDSVDVFGFVRQMRYQRNFMVQTEAQYVFIHDALLEAITCGVTEVEAKDLSARIRELRQFDPETGYTYLENEFCRLAKEENHPIAFKSASLNCNAAKNRYANILPFESTRVHLKMRPGEMGSDYINANFIDGYCQPRAYIATQAPVPDTFEDFWRLIWEQESATIVMLTREEEAGKVKCHHYWPNEGSRLYGVILVELTEEASFGDYVSRKFKLTHTEEKESRTVSQFQYTDWPDTGTPDSGVGIVDLIGQVQKWQQQSGNTIIVIHCSGGVGRTGVFCGISMMIERLKSEGVIDVFQTVQAMRLQRPAMVQTAEQYEFCYTTLQEYLDSFDLYANFQ